MGRTALPDSVRPYQGEGDARDIPAIRSDLGRNGYEHAFGRGIGQAVLVWSEVL
jgi:hypothetical protein